MKKLLSFAVACSMCLCSTFSALAVGQAGDTTIADKDGNIFTLSNPILYTFSASDLKDKIYFRYNDGEYDLQLRDIFLMPEGEMPTIYAVPSGTVVYASDNTFFGGIIPTMANLVKHNDSYYKISDDEYYVTGRRFKDFQVYSESSGGALYGFQLVREDFKPIIDTGGVITAPDPSYTIFYVTNDTTENPFASLPKINDVNFTDVVKDSYYENAVRWAVNNGITSGTSETTFNPNQTCTTAQIITLLWRQNGQPEPKIENPFFDVSQSDYFYKPALWAYEKGLVTGDKFNGNSPCTRIATVTYFYNLSDKTMGSYPMMSQFIDVPQTSKDYEIVKWAVSNEITSGTDYNKFSPNDTCTRGQIVTFMYRAFISNLD